ncbi:MAG TPA: N-6 DNA methylase [Verrucomicrobiae bacterium]
MPTDQTFLSRAIADGHAELTGEGKQQKIRYIAADHTERYADPEEQVRAEFWAELIYHYGYEPERIGLEIIVPRRTPADRADIVVFHDREQKRPFAVIECKRDGVTDAEFSQAVEQACGNRASLGAPYSGVVAGRTRRWLEFTGKTPPGERETNIIADLPREYGEPEEWRFLKGDKDRDIRKVDKEELIAAIKKCHQTLWGGGRLSPPAAFGELCKLIFVKISDEQAPRKKGEPYEFQIKTHEPPQKLGARIRALYERQKTRDPDVFTETIKIDDLTLRTVVSHLESINLNQTDLDTKGVAFEQFMDGFFKGDFGQYFTPREIIDFAVSMLKPKNDDRVLDPCCGSGGFLLHALDAVRREADEFHLKDSAPHFKHWHEFARTRLFGIEINEEIARVAKMNMIIHDDGHTNVIGADALDPIADLEAINPGFRKNYFDLVLTNPPFGSMVKEENKPGLLASFELSRYVSKPTTGTDPDDTGRTDSDIKAGKRALKQRTSVKTEILFIERVWQFLTPGTGRAAIVLPDGILTKASLQSVRDWMLYTCA